MRGDRIRFVREALNLTQEELAELAKTSQLQIYRYESGKNKPKADELANIATALHVSSDYLLGLSDEPHGYATDNLDDYEQSVVDALRRGDKMQAVKVIVNG